MKRAIIIFAVLLISIFTYANTKNDSLLSLANQKYNEGLYNEAILFYLKITENGFESSQLYYNLGNSYFKNNDFPSAILYYEKARKINPNDEDIIYNLSIVNSRIVDKIEIVPQIIFKRWWNLFYHMFSVNHWAKISIGLFLSLLIFTSFYLIAQKRLIKKIFFISSLFLLIFTIASLIVSHQKYYYTKNQKEAILFTSTITVKSSPSQNSVDLFVIHEGTKIYILDQLGDWIEVRIANGSTGWLPESVVKYI